MESPKVTQEMESGTEVHGFHANYFMVFVALCVCTLISAGFDLISFENRIVLAVLVLGIALAKALFVMAYVMHLKFERGWKYVLLAPTIFLASGIPLALYSDISLHYYQGDTAPADTTPPAGESP